MHGINKIATGISFSKELLKQIDEDRGDVSRSRYITTFLEKRYPIKNTIEKENKMRKKKEEKNNLVRNKMELPRSRVGPLLSGNSTSQ